MFSMSQADSMKIERIQKTCLKVILGDMYLDYGSALEMSNLETLQSRRTKRCLKFALKSMKHTRMKSFFPINNRKHGQSQSAREFVEVNWARTETYRISAIPFCQRLVNENCGSK